ncbi:DEAD box protein [Pelomyxa schiedti]|nr:DEAD box protein [Pelomyxa schiedti]
MTTKKMTTMMMKRDENEDDEDDDNEPGDDDDDEEEEEKEDSDNENEEKPLTASTAGEYKFASSSDTASSASGSVQPIETIKEVYVEGVLQENTGKEYTFKDLGLCPELCLACTKMGWVHPTEIQRETIPLALRGKDIIGLAETGSGKTAAYALPTLHALLDKPIVIFALILLPTRELAYQVTDQYEKLGQGIGVRVCALVGGLAPAIQAAAIAKRPHIIIATPGRLNQHLSETRGFSLETVKFLVFDEADKLLGTDWENQVDTALLQVPKTRQTLMFSATMTAKVSKLKRTSLSDPVQISIGSKYATAKTLHQFYIFVPFKHRNCYVAYLLMVPLVGHQVLVFCERVIDVLRLTLMLRNLGIVAIPLHGQMSQAHRLAALNKIKNKEREVLVATEIAARGLDLPDINYVINYDVPELPKSYIHRVGRTARAGATGSAITLVTQYSVERFQRIEHVMEQKLPEYPLDHSVVLLLLDRANHAETVANTQLKVCFNSFPAFNN